jgi:glucose/arabinose dehydrogenase
MKKTVLTLSVFFLTVISSSLFSQALPAAYVQTTIVSGLRHPADFDWTPDGRYICTQKGDNSFPAANAFIKIFSASGTLIGTFYDLTDSVDSDFERGLLGVAVDPNFATNHYVYAYYDYRNPAQTNLAIRVVRFTEVANVGTSPTLILNLVYATSPTTYAGNHFGGIIRFRPSEPTKLYIQLGDLAYNQGGASAALNYADKLNKPYGKILRINTDGTIPTDNPYYDDGNPATGNDDRIWSYGNRNMFGMCFSPVTDSMYSSENGWNKWDEFNIIHKGANYGWNTCEGNFLNSSTTSPCTLPGAIAPMTTWGTPLPAVTGCVYYSGTAVMPEFDNHLLVADNDYGRIYDLTLGNAPAYDIVTSKTTFADITAGGLLAMRQGPTDGCIYALEGGYTLNGKIHRICKAGVGIASNEPLENIVGQNYPNPTNGITQIDYSIAQASAVSIQLFDVTGRNVKTILNANDVVAGKHTVDVIDLEKFANGSYFYKIEVKQNNKIVYTETKRLMLAK